MTPLKRIIITGATGSIGCAIVKQACKRGYDLTCIVHRGSERTKNIVQLEHVHIVECNLNEYTHLSLEGNYDIFIHLAWDKTYGALRDDTEVQQRNIQYTLDACRLAQRCGCSVFIGAGSQAEYGVQTLPLTPDLPVAPESGYGIAKYAAGRLSLMLAEQLGMRGNWIRVLSVYGAQDNAKSLIQYAISELQQGRSPKLTKCEQIWDYLYADDAADAFLDVAEKGKPNQVYVIGSGQSRQLKDYIHDIGQCVNPNVNIAFGSIAYYPHQPMYLAADISAISNDTQWKPEHSFVDGINLMINAKQ